VLLHLTAGQVSDHKGARELLPRLPKATALIGDRGCDGNWFRSELTARDIEPCIPGRKNRRQHVDHDMTLYKQRHKIENMFAKLKDWRRIATRYDRCAHTFLSAIRLAAIVAFYLVGRSEKLTP
jgi:transposase